MPLQEAFWICIMCGRTGFGPSYQPLHTHCRVADQPKVQEKIAIAKEALRI